VYVHACTCTRVRARVFQTTTFSSIGY
jgi:hypothetical protein